jgi:ATP/ADP translocase
MDDVECHWGTTIANMIKVMEKNYFAAIDFRFGIVVVCILFSLGVTTILISGLLSGTVIGLIAALSPLLGFFPATILARRLGWSAFTALRAPFMVPVFMYALLNSTFVTLRQGGVRWRDTFYSLKTLRAGGVR